MKITLHKRRNWGLTLLELLPPVGLVGMMGIGASALLPALAKAKARANRIKCVSNIKQVGDALKAFANDNNDRYPWLLLDEDKVAQGGNTMWVNETSTLLAQAAIRANLGSAKILVSPLDPDNQAVNDTIDLARVTLAKPVPNGGHSYGVVNGEGGSNHAADDARPSTVLTVTRNISGPANKEDSLSDQGDNPFPKSTAKKFALWKGADKHPIDARTMAGLLAGQGQLSTSDGAVTQSNDADLRRKTIAHHNEQGGSFKGSPSGFLDTPND